MKKYLILVLLLSLLGGGVLYWRKSRYPLRFLQSSQQFTLYSLNPSRAIPQEETLASWSKKPKFHKFLILGQTTNSDAPTKEKLIEVLSSGLASSGNQASCFNPRHGIRAINGSQTVDVFICFECGYLQTWENGKSSELRPFSQEGQDIFDHVLRDAKVPLGKRDMH